jgi:hypothetical protein
MASRQEALDHRGQGPVEGMFERVEEFAALRLLAGGCLGAMEVIKLLTGLGEPLLSRMITFDLRTMSFRKIKTTCRLTLRAGLRRGALF